MRTPAARPIARPVRLWPLAASVWLSLLGSASAVSLAELEVTEYSRGSPGASATFGYFYNNPDRVTSAKTVTPTTDGSGDVYTRYFNRYRNDARVNAGRLSGVALMGSPAPGHSYAKAFGYADAGVDLLGGYTNMGGYARALAGAHPSSAYARTTTEIQFTWVVGPGESGAAVGDLITGLRWEFGAHGFLGVAGTTWRESTNSYADMDFHSDIRRGSGGLCGPVACPNNTPAAEFDAYAGLQALSQAPAQPDLYTGTVQRYLSWQAASNTGDGGAWGNGPSWGEQGAWVLAEASRTENAAISRTIGVDTGDHLDHIDFDATVGETLRLTATLDLLASVDGVGEAEADFWDTFSTRIFDPAARGYALSFAVAPVPIPEPATWLLWLAGAAMLWMRLQRFA
jgi:hypothetical protein